MRFDAKMFFEHALSFYKKKAKQRNAGVRECDAEELVQDATVRLWQEVQALQDAGKITKTALARLKVACWAKELKQYKNRRKNEALHLRHNIEAADVRNEDGEMLPQPDTMRYGEGVAGVRSMRRPTLPAWLVSITEDDFLFASFVEKHPAHGNAEVTRTQNTLKSLVLKTTRTPQTFDENTPEGCAYLQALAAMLRGITQETRRIMIRRALLRENAAPPAQPGSLLQLALSINRAPKRLTKTELAERTGLNDAAGQARKIRRGLPAEPDHSETILRLARRAHLHRLIKRRRTP